MKSRRGHGRFCMNDVYAWAQAVNINGFRKIAEGFFLPPNQNSRSQTMANLASYHHPFAPP